MSDFSDEARKASENERDQVEDTAAGPQCAQEAASQAEAQGESMPGDVAGDLEQKSGQLEHEAQHEAAAHEDTMATDASGATSDAMRQGEGPEGEVTNQPAAHEAISDVQRATSEDAQQGGQEEGTGGWWHALWERIRGRAGAAPGGGSR